MHILFPLHPQVERTLRPCTRMCHGTFCLAGKEDPDIVVSQGIAIGGVFHCLSKLEIRLVHGRDIVLPRVISARVAQAQITREQPNLSLDLIKIDEVVVLGEVTVTAAALHLLLERDIEITFLGCYGQFKGPRGAQRVC